MIFEHKEDPYRFVERLVDSQYNKMRVGRFRVIMDINKAAIQISIVKIGDRSRVYS